LTYEYSCPSCGKTFDVIKSYRDMDVNETCPKCGEYAVRQFVPSKLHITGAKVTHAEYNPGLGCVVQNKHHKAEIMKRKGVMEVGNDFKTPDRMVDHFDKGREEKMRKRWEDA
jgi:putative FmdB family regulatory protein